MASEQNSQNMRADRLIVYANDNELPGQTKVSRDVVPIIHKHRIVSVGASDIAEQIVGWKGLLKLDFNELTLALFERAYRTGATAPRNFGAVGSVDDGSGLVIRLRDPADTNGAYEMTLFRCTWKPLPIEHDGEGETIFPVEVAVMMNPATMVFGRIGAAS